MKVIFLDFDGVISTYEMGWRIDPNKLMLVDKIIQATDAKIVVTSSWKHGYKTIEDFKDSLSNNWRTDKTTNVNLLISNIFDMTDSKSSWRGDEIQHYLENHNDVENYVILDDDSDFKNEQLFNFVQTDTYEGLTSREVKLCISILNGKKVVNPIRLNLVLTTMWRNKCSGLEKNNIEQLLKEYRNRFNWK